MRVGVCKLVLCISILLFCLNRSSLSKLQLRCISSQRMEGELKVEMREVAVLVVEGGCLVRRRKGRRW